MTVTIDIGQCCVGCGRDTSFGSGLFVNRFGADAEWTIESSCSDNRFVVSVDGWMCAECGAWECDECGKSIPLDEDVYVEHPTLYALHVHRHCVQDGWWQYTDYPEDAPSVK